MHALRGSIRRIQYESLRRTTTSVDSAQESAVRNEQRRPDRERGLRRFGAEALASDEQPQHEGLYGPERRRRRHVLHCLERPERRVPARRSQALAAIGLLKRL